MTLEEWELGRRYFSSLPKASREKTDSWNLTHFFGVFIRLYLILFDFRIFGHGCETKDAKAMLGAYWG